MSVGCTRVFYCEDLTGCPFTKNGDTYFFSSQSGRSGRSGWLVGSEPVFGVWGEPTERLTFLPGYWQPENPSILSSGKFKIRGPTMYYI